MRYLLVLLGLLVTSTAQAVDCQSVPSCTELGYTKEPDPNCKSDGYIFCPFDKSYKKCVNYNCESLGFTNTDKSSWCKNIATCRTDNQYTLCVKATCEIGDVFYADGSCGLVDDYDGSKIPVGVVFYTTDGGYHGKVINLHNLGRSSSSAEFDPTKPYDTASSSSFPWGIKGTDIQDLMNWDCSNYPQEAVTGNYNDAFWSQGKAYTENIAKAQNNNLQYAAPAALAFYPPNVYQNDSKVGVGNWYLPTLGELMDLYGYDYSSLGECKSSTGAKGGTKNTVNVTLTALKNKGVTAEALTGFYYWSSTEYNSSSSWNFGMGDGSRTDLTKSEARLVRVSLEF